MERTLVLIKPDGLEHSDEIIDIFCNNGLEVDKFKIMQMTEELVYEHYNHLIDKPFFNNLKEYMMSNVIVALILSGEDAVKKTRSIIGATNPAKAEEGTIRALFGLDATRNTVHASDSNENAEIEIKRFFGKNKVLSK